MADDAPVFRDPNVSAARDIGIKLLREILDYQRRIDLLAAEDDPDDHGLLHAYRRAIRVRRELLRDLSVDPALPATA
jgi:hypothetical protein